MKKGKKIIAPIICIILAVFIGVGIYYVVQNNQADSPEQVVESFLTAVTKGNVKKAIKYSAMDYEDYITDAYSEENLKVLIKENSKGMGDQFATPQDFYNFQSQNYGVSINSGKDMYNAMLSKMGSKMSVKSIEITKTTPLDLKDEDTKTLINFYQRYNFTGLDSSEYYDPNEITEIVDVAYTVTLENGEENTGNLAVVKIDGEWKVLFSLSDLSNEQG